MKRKSEDILIIGCSCMDYLSRIEEPEEEKGKQYGSLFITPGGVGRNVSENLAYLDDNITFITALGEDENGEKIRKQLEDLNVRVLSPETQRPTSIYNSISDASGKKIASIFDNTPLENLKPKDFKPYEAILQMHKHIVLEADLSESVLEYLFKTYKGHRFYVEGVSTDKVGRFKNYLKDITLFKSNFNEGQSLFNEERLTPEKVVQKIMDAGCPHVVLSHTELPIFYGTKGQIYREPIVVRKKFTRHNGVGDALFAGVVHCLIQGMPLSKAVKFGLNMSYYTLGVDTSVDPNIAELI